jgi:hypothetical protein
MTAGSQILLVAFALLGHCLGEACVSKGQHQQEKISLQPHALADRDEGGKVKADCAHRAYAQLALIGRDQ